MSFFWMRGACNCSLILMTYIGEANVLEMAAAVPLTRNSMINCFPFPSSCGTLTGFDIYLIIAKSIRATTIIKSFFQNLIHYFVYLAHLATSPIHFAINVSQYFIMPVKLGPHILGMSFQLLYFLQQFISQLVLFGILSLQHLQKILFV